MRLRSAYRSTSAAFTSTVLLGRSWMIVPGLDDEEDDVTPRNLEAAVLSEMYFAGERALREKGRERE